jgi:phosphoenolpyruvate synthase/pyruvate phosphate dikinase
MRPVYWFEEVKQELVKHIGSSAWRIGQLKNLEVSSALGFILLSVFTDNFLDETQNAKLKSQLLK